MLKKTEINKILGKAHNSKMDCLKNFMHLILSSFFSDLFFFALGVMMQPKFFTNS